MLSNSTSRKEYFISAFPPDSSNIQISKYSLGDLCASLANINEDFFNDEITKVSGFLSELDSLLAAKSEQGDRQNSKNLFGNFKKLLPALLSSSETQKASQEATHNQKYTGQDSSEANLLFRIADYISTRFASADDLLSTVLFQITAYKIYYPLMRNTQSVDYTYDERQQLNEGILDEQGNIDHKKADANHALLIENQDKYIPAGDEEDAFYRWLGILNDPSLIYSLPFSAKLLLPSAQKYLNELKYQLNSCKWFSKSLPRYFELDDSAENEDSPDCSDDFSFQNLTNGLSDVSQIPFQTKIIGIAIAFRLAEYNPYPALSFITLADKNNQVYYPKNMLYCRSISGIVAQELHQCKAANLSFKRCELCGRFFLPRSITAKFCHRPNPNHNDNPCYRVGRQIKRRKKRSECPVTRKFDRNNQSYQEWVRRNKTKYSTETVAQIQSNYGSWLAAAEAAVDQYSKTDSSEEKEQLLKMLDLPSRYVRSPLIYSEKGRTPPK